MDSESFKILWIGTCASAGLGVIIALLSTVGTLPRWSVVCLAILGGFSFSFTAIGIGWVDLHHLNSKSILILCVTWLLMGVFGLVLRTRVNAKGDPHRMAEEWNKLASQFHAVANNSIRADWNRMGDGTETWNVCGGDHQTCEALCRLAGATLARSPRVFPKLQESVRLEFNYLHRWLSFVKGDAANITGMGYGTETDRHGNSRIHLYGSINNLAEVSRRVCIDCAAVET